jgi:hypothetical protein
LERAGEVSMAQPTKPIKTQQLANDFSVSSVELCGLETPGYQLQIIDEVFISQFLGIKE